MDLIKFMRELIEDDPILKQMIEEDDRYKEERKQLHLNNGCDEEAALIRAWEDYWKMANERDGVEFSINEL